MSDQFYFEFSEWEDAFATFYRKHGGERLYATDGSYLGRREGDKSLVLLISTSPETAGYWIERGAEADEDTHVYTTMRDVKNLERRVRRRIERAKGHATGLIL